MPCPTRTGHLEIPASSPAEKAEDSFSTPSWQLTSDEVKAMASTSLESEDHARRSISVTSMDFVDWEILRATSLKASLRNWSQLWRYNPASLSQKERQAVYCRARKAKHFHVFVSHTWQTKGRWKALSLLLQCGWWHALLWWLVLVPLTMYLCVLDVLPYRKTGEFEGPLSRWVLSSGFLATLMGLMTAPYWPSSQECFIDAASIDQSSPESMHRGIRSIGGVLLVSDELRVLWSQPYLSRAWCIFELAVYRKGNPGGRLRLAPLFVEQFVAYTYFALYAAAVGYWFVRDSGGVLGFPAFALAMVPFVLATHVLRQSFMSKHELLQQFKDFDLAAAECSEEGDRRFIHRSIEKWYGSVEAFNAFVRGPLRQELIEPVVTTQLPRSYMMLLILPTLNLTLEFLVGFLRMGTSFEELARFFIISIFSTNFLILPAALELLFLLCDQFASPGCGALQNLLCSLLVYAVFATITGAALSALTSAWTRTLPGALAGAAGALLSLLLVLMIKHCMRLRAEKQQLAEHSAHEP